MAKINGLINLIDTYFPEKQENKTEKYSFVKYPKFFPMIKMKVKSFKIEKFGSLMIMQSSMMGMMNLITFSFTPSTGLSVPFLLIDYMSMGKKRLAYFELYDCRKIKSPLPGLESLKDKYSFINDYNEKLKWYVDERMKGSLIKTAASKNEDKLLDMIEGAILEYRNCIDEAETRNFYDDENLTGLKAFASRMKTEGNPSTSLLEKALGKKGSIDFFDRIIMPLDVN